LKQSLITKYANKNTQVWTPKNCQVVRLEMRGEKIAKAVGRLAVSPPSAGDSVSGLVVRRAFTHHLLDPVDLHTYTHLKTTLVRQKLSVPFHHPWDIIVRTLRTTYDDIQQSPTDDGAGALLIFSAISVTPKIDEAAAGLQIVLEWTSNPVNDMLADSIVAYVLNLEMTTPHIEAQLTREEELFTLLSVVRMQFGSECTLSEQVNKAPTISVDRDQVIATIQCDTMEVMCENAGLKEEVEACVRRVWVTLKPLRINK